MKKMGKQTIKFKNPPSINGFYSIVGKKEGEGPLCDYFDTILEDDKYGEKSWEKAESKLIKEAAINATKVANIPLGEVEYMFAGDLLNQCVSSNYAMRELQIPFFGLYGACSTMAESLSLGAMTIDGEYAKNVLCATSSHFCSAERQFRFPLEYGGERTATSQWTVTGSGAVVLSDTGGGPYIKYITTGKIIDLGVKDGNNMGAAMAPAAADTLITHFNDTGKTFKDYDLIVTGDLGLLGKGILTDLLNDNGFDTYSKLDDCGVRIFDLEKQDVHCGGSGCGCGASVLTSEIIKEIKKGTYKNVGFMATGALMSPVSSQQGESIPGIAHFISISSCKEGA